MQSIATDSVLGGTALEDQIRRERLYIADTGRRNDDRRNDAVKRGAAAALGPEASLIEHWMKPVTREVAKYQRKWEAGQQTSHAAFIAPIVLGLKPERVAEAILKTIFNSLSSSGNGRSRTKLFFDLGEALAAEAGYDFMTSTEEGKKAAKAIYRRYKKMTASRLRRAHRKLVGDVDFAREVIVKTGSWSFLLLSQLCQIPVRGGDPVDCFRLYYRMKGRKKLAHIDFTATALRFIEESHGKRRYVNPLRPLMVCPPMPRPGGPYITIRRPLVVKCRPLQRLRIEEADMTLSMRALDDASNVPLRVNTRMLPVVEALWKEGDGQAGIPMPEPKKYPPKPYGFDATKKGKEAWAGVDDEAKRLWKIRAAGVHKHNIQTKADRRTFAMMMQMADEGSRYDAFYCPMAFEFRSRMVPEPQYLNHYNGDAARCLLQYADAVPLGDDGLYWLAVHAANCYGNDKVSFDERVRWVEANIGEMRKCARDPLGNRWWMTGDEKTRLQFLAACIAIDDPKTEGVYQPCQFDATCNGTQHYAALGRDRDLASLVNLTPTDSPNSLYQTVTDAVKPLVEREADAGNASAIFCRPALIRKVLKQPVMTDGYGVTEYGATDQILGQFDELGLISEKPTLEETQKATTAARYLATTIMRELGKISRTSADIKAWMVESAKAVARTGVTVELTSPIGFPMVQPYRIWKPSLLRVVGCWVRMPSFNDKEPPKVGKQGSAFPPNAIHMLDGTVNALTIMNCANEDIKLLTVCDSFWPHAGNATRMREVYKEQFVAMHERPLLDEMAQQLWTLAPGADIADPPARGTWDVRETLLAEYPIA